MSRIASILMVLAVTVLSGCVVRKTEVVRMGPAVAGQAERVDAAPAGGEHVVTGGDTLYSIAFRNHADWRELASWNGLTAPYTIYPGQRLRLDAPSPSTMRPPDLARARPLPEVRPLPSVAAGDSSDRIVPVQAGTPDPAPPAPPAAAPAIVPSQPSPVVAPAPVVAAPEPVAPARPVVVEPAPAARSTPTPNAVAIEPAPTQQVSGIQWRWPTQGEVIQRYSTQSARPGIAIAGRSGQAVVAAADGEVVYSGSGLRGYGELIIIKHSAELLSAYAHNNKRLVNEHERVRAGQPIAEMGRTGADRDKLHFEIRRAGEPVDPMGFLPRR